MECELVLVQMLPAEVVLRWAMQLPVVVVWVVFSLLVMLWVWLLATLGAAFIGLSGSDKLGINEENRSG